MDFKHNGESILRRLPAGNMGPQSFRWRYKELRCNPSQHFVEAILNEYPQNNRREATTLRLDINGRASTNNDNLVGTSCD